MNRVNRFLQIIITLTALFWSTFSFAQEDSITALRTVGDFFNITISGARNGDFANVELIRISETRSILNPNPPCGEPPPGLDIYALVVTGGDVNATSHYSKSFQMELPGGPHWVIALYVADTLLDYQIGNFSMVDLEMLDKVYDYPGDYLYYLDVTDSSFEAQPEGVITIRNLKVRGFDDLSFWATFQWNPGSLKFELKDAGQ